eukprot:398876_1
MLLWLCLLVGFVSHSLSTPNSHGDFINVGTPGGVTVSFDCTVRQYAYSYAQSKWPRNGKFVNLFDALQLQVCNMTRPNEEDSHYIPIYKSSFASCTFYVDPTNGKDSNDGSQTAPFLTIQRGIQATRTQRTGNELCELNLMSGTFYLNETIELTDIDSFLTIQNFNGNEVTISGGIQLQFDGTWNLYNYTEIGWKNYSNMNAVFGRADQQASNDLIIYLGIAQTYDECVSKADQSNRNFHSLTWHDKNFKGWAGECYGINDMSWQPVQQQDVYSGRYIGKNIWSRKVSNVNDIPGLRVNNIRAIRSRYPDINPEIAMQYDPNSGWIIYDTKWKPPAKYPPSTDVIRNATNYNNVEWPMDGPGGTPYTGEGDWGNFWIGKGGSCEYQEGLEPGYGYWCSTDAPRMAVGDGIQPHKYPTGIYIDSTAVPNAPYNSDISDAIINSWRPSHWFNWMFSTQSYNKQTGELIFGRGGFQGGEGTPNGDIWFIENVFEELTMPMEYFYNKTESILYYFNNETTSKKAPSDSTIFVSTNLKRLFNLTASQTKPIKNVTIKGITFRDTSYTYLDDHGLPTGGDWAIARQGAITIEGGEYVTIASNLFTRLDGNVIFLSGYNRNVTINNNDFEWIGESTIALWGRTSGLQDIIPDAGPDGRNGDQPRFTQITNNYARELGIFEKQSSFVFQAASCQTIIENNIFFNGPRAAINFNDGFGGSNVIRNNMLLNTCRESGDHGPFNSWDRVPYITLVGSGKPSIIPGYNEFYNNFWFANYQSVGAIDTDDGSAYYNIYNNFFVYGDMGLKGDYGGHNVFHVYNLYGYTGSAFNIWGESGANDQFMNNQVVLINDNSYQSNCKLPPGTAGMKIANNSIYLPSGKLTICGETFQQWQSKGNDPGTTINKLPSDQQVIDWAKKMLS